MSPDSDRRALIYCSGTNRFGRPCTRTVTHEGDRCGHCHGISELPTFDVATTASVPEPVETLDWTVAGALQKRLKPLAEDNPQLNKLVEVCIRLAANSRSANSKASYDQHW